MTYEKELKKLLDRLRREGYPEELLKRLKAVKGKRSQIVILHILKHGSITTEQLRSKYNYDHPPRAKRDVVEQGIPLETIKVKDSKGRTIAAYRLGRPSEIRKEIRGRKAIPKGFKDRLIEEHDARCAICRGRFDDRYLQVDHRVPYEVSGDPATQHPEAYMLLCGSCNRAKSWSCANWLQEKNPQICRSCYWSNPESYKHIALQAIRRLDVVWTEQEIEEYERLKKRTEALKTEIPEYVKKIIRNHIKKTPLP